MAFTASNLPLSIKALSAEISSGKKSLFQWTNATEGSQCHLLVDLVAGSSGKEKSRAIQSKLKDFWAPPNNWRIACIQLYSQTCRPDDKIRLYQQLETIGGFSKRLLWFLGVKMSYHIRYYSNKHITCIK